jgi:enoyl-[acyl-carrier protein] reductase II
MVKKEQSCKEIIEEIFLEARKIIIEKSKLI